MLAIIDICMIEAVLVGTVGLFSRLVVTSIQEGELLFG
jgi:hypothetical protein